MYIDGFVVPVPQANRDAYRQMAAEVWPLFRDHGALRLVECWGDDVPEGKVTDFYRAVGGEAGENVVFSWIVWASKEARDKGNAAMMNDERMKPPADPPFNMQRMIFGGFEVLLDEGEKL